MGKIAIGDRIIGKSIDLDYMGQGVVKNDGYVFFVENLLLNEEAEFSVVSLKKNFGRGKVIKFIKKSPNRIERSDNIYGATDLLHLDIASQIKWQETLTKNMLSRALDETIILNKTISTKKTENYRNKSVFRVMNEDHLTLGMYDKSNQRLIKVDDFILSSPLANKIVKTINDYHFPLIDDNIKYVAIRTNDFNQALVTFVIKDPKKLRIKPLVNHLRTINEITGITLNLNDVDYQILGNKSIVIYGSDEMINQTNGLDLTISDQTFFQINNSMTDLVYQEIAKNIQTNDHVFDCYSGVGGIGISLAKKAKHVTLIESNKSSCLMAQKNQERNKITNITIINDLVENQEITGNTIIIDPPRSGLDNKFIEIVKESQATKLIYLSCNLATLTRDLKNLISSFKIVSITPIRMFPHTTSTETLVILERSI